jgi:hypothetical protein
MCANAIAIAVKQISMAKNMLRHSMILFSG